MKALFLIVFLSFSAIATAQPVLTFERIFSNFDTIAYGGNGSFQIKFTNTGNKPLIITSCQTATGADMCSCDKNPIAPGKSGFIDYKFETNRCGRWNKSITVMSNAGEPVILYVKAFVTCPPPAESEPKPDGTSR